MPALRGLRAAAVAVVLAASGSVALASPATAAPPDVKNDHKWIYAGSFRSIDVLANDTDPDGDELAICRVETPDDAEYYAEEDDGKLAVYVPEDPGENLVIHYYVCDFETLVPATLTLSFREIHPLKITKLDRPGLLRVTNENALTVKFLYGSFREPRPDGRTRVFANDSVVVRVHRQRIDWVAYFAKNGVLVGIGHVRGIELPARDTSSDRTRLTFTRADMKHWSAQR